MSSALRKTPPPLHRKNLVIVRAGDRSLHGSWIAQTNRDFDLFVSYFGQQANLHQDSCDYYEMRPGPKWPCIGDILHENPDLLNQYEAFWFPDDDLSTTTDNINQMFSLFHGFQLALAQPALTRDSYYSWKHLLQQPNSIMRISKFVEIMAPIFDRQALLACQSTFNENQSGWGLDWIWPQLCGRGRKDSIAVIDATPVKHTRALGAELYKKHSITPHDDESEIFKKYKIDPKKQNPQYSSLKYRIKKVRANWLLRLWIKITK